MWVEASSVRCPPHVRHKSRASRGRRTNRRASRGLRVQDLALDLDDELGRQQDLDLLLSRHTHVEQHRQAVLDRCIRHLETKGPTRAFYRPGSGILFHSVRSRRLQLSDQSRVSYAS